MIDRNRSTSRSRTITSSDRTGTESLQVSPGGSFPLSESSTSSTSMSNAMTLIDPLDSRRSSAVTQPTDQSYGMNFYKKKSKERDQDHPLLSLTVDRRELDEEADLMSWQAGRRGNAQTEEENDDYDDLDEGDLTLKRVLELTDPAIDGLITPGGGGGGRGELNGGRRTTDSGAGISSGSDNQESMARFMNRKASLLMLTFPLAYVVLFSVSIIRIVWDFGPNTPSPVFTAISRWMIFMQGLLDAVIYGLVETLVKRQVKKKTRRVLGTGLGTGGSYTDPRASVANTRTDTASRI
ncbi:g-protein coupled receptor-carbon and camp sensor protein [Phaffia rhodozyma]|uniref:G-protein coupled receptor-carbon and camp sensor protein n=1 Tax=Phaffia rhodozyma TaxID=264483 RepID=A0A0F7SKH0_PHARH|nr:g-protein coupled receptor-carbon and camp sensor protein [Phaffia rhodozyma]